MKPKIYRAKPDLSNENKEVKETLEYWFKRNKFMDDEGYVHGQLVFDDDDVPYIAGHFADTVSGVCSMGNWEIIDPDTLEEVK